MQLWRTCMHVFVSGAALGPSIVSLNMNKSSLGQCARMRNSHRFCFILLLLSAPPLPERTRQCAHACKYHVGEKLRVCVMCVCASCLCVRACVRLLRTFVQKQSSLQYNPKKNCYCMFGVHAKSERANERTCVSGCVRARVCACVSAHRKSVIFFVFHTIAVRGTASRSGTPLTCKPPPRAILIDQRPALAPAQCVLRRKFFQFSCCMNASAH